MCIASLKNIIRQKPLQLKFERLINLSKNVTFCMGKNDSNPRVGNKSRLYCESQHHV